MAANEKSIAALVPFRFKPGQSGNPGGKPGKKNLGEWQDFAAGIPFDVIDPGTGRPFEDPETGEPLNRDDMVKQATFRAAIDLRRKDCTRAQQTWNAYVRGTPRPGGELDPKSDNGAAVIPAVVKVYRIPDNGRGPRAQDVHPPAPDAPKPPVPEKDGPSR